MTKGLHSREDVPWSKRQEIPDPQILDAAEQYEKACKLLEKQRTGVLLPLMNTAAMAVELYLKCLSAELIHIADKPILNENLIIGPAAPNEQPPREVSRVYSAPAITSGKGHGLVALLNIMHQDVRCALINAFDAELRDCWNQNLQSVLAELEGVLLASRYPFEHNIDISRYTLDHLLGLADFLGRFVRSFPSTDRIEWKRHD